MKSVLSIFNDEHINIIDKLRNEQFKVNILEVNEGSITKGYTLCLIFFHQNQKEELKNILTKYILTKEEKELSQDIYQSISSTKFNIPVMLIDDIL